MSSKVRAKRAARDHQRRLNAPKLNLVALMDIFTILVFFLMVNNGDVEVLQTDGEIALPKSVAMQKPAEELVVKITADSVLVQGRVIVSVAEVLAESAPTITALAQELDYQADRQGLGQGQVDAAVPPLGRPAIIMGDSDMPYALLKRVMTTLAQSDYRDLALAVDSIAGSEQDPEILVAER